MCAVFVERGKTYVEKCRHASTESRNCASKSTFHLSHILALLVVSRGGKQKYKRKLQGFPQLFAGNLHARIFRSRLGQLSRKIVCHKSGIYAAASNYFPQFFLFSYNIYFAIPGRGTETPREWERERERQQTRLVIEFAKFSWLGKLVCSLFFNLISFTFLALSHSRRKLWQITFDAASKMSFDTHKYLIWALQSETDRERERCRWENGNENGKISSYGKFKWQAKYS